MADPWLHNNQVFDISINVPKGSDGNCYDDDGRLKRTGKNPSFPRKDSIFIVPLLLEIQKIQKNKKILNFFVCSWCVGTVWTASSHIITAVIGSGVLSLAWATAQLGWVAGPAMLFLFSFVTYYTSTLLAACYRSGDADTGKRNYTYMDAVRANLGLFVSFLEKRNVFCGIWGLCVWSWFVVWIFRWVSGETVWGSSVLESFWDCHWLHHCSFH